jgi:hypothetical protein
LRKGNVVADRKLVASLVVVALVLIAFFAYQRMNLNFLVATTDVSVLKHADLPDAEGNEVIAVIKSGETMKSIKTVYNNGLTFYTVKVTKQNFGYVMRDESAMVEK